MEVVQLVNNILYHNHVIGSCNKVNMSFFLYYILSLEKRIRNKFDNKKEPYYIAMKNECKINSTLVNEPCLYIGRKIELKMNFVLTNEPCMTVGKSN